MGKFQPGQSGNPGGRPKENNEVKELARLHTAEAVERLAHWMRSDNPKASVGASVALIERGWGRAPQDVVLTADVSESFAKLWNLISDGAATELADRLAEKPGQSASVRH